MIGIIGGYGEVGLQACLLLQKWGKKPLKIGGRNPRKGQKKHASLISNSIWEEVNAEELISLRKFINGCDLVINCAGPSHRFSEKIIKECILQGCHLVDAGMGVRPSQFAQESIERAMIYAAGATPGLSGLFQIWFGHKWEAVNSILCYTGALGQLTRSGAEDYLEGVLHHSNQPRTAWRNQIVPNLLPRETGIRLPFFPRETTLLPVFDAETHLVAKRLDLQNGDWYVAVDGDNIMLVLGSASLQYQSNPKAVIEKLYLATQLDTAGRKPYFKLLVQITGVKGGKKLTQTAVLESGETTTLTGSVAGVLAMAVLEDHLKPGLQHLSSIENVNYVMDKLSETNCIREVTYFDSTIEELMIEEEGDI
jgi:hypothetical protein